MPRRQLSRRSFLKTSTTCAASVLGAPAANVRAANETRNVGCIGTGGRCRALMKSLQKLPNVRIAAVRDIYDAHLKLARELADPKAIATKQYKEVLDRKDIDAVLIGSTDHWHVPMTVDACAAGKDVYVEKTVDPQSGRRTDHPRCPEETSTNRPGRNAAAQYAADSKSPRTGTFRPLWQYL